MKIIIGSDHVALPLKVAVIQHLQALGNEVTDVGPHLAEPPVDYPDFAQTVSRKVQDGSFEFGILICGTGLGMSIAANKMPGIRAALCYDEYTAQMSRAHNDANVLCLGQWTITPQLAIGIVDRWLNTEFEAGRHLRRIAKLRAEKAASDGLDRPPNILKAGAWCFAASISPNQTVFAPILFAGRLHEGFAALADAGFDGVELSLRTPEDIPLNTLSDLLQTHQLALSAIATGQGCLQDGACLCAPDPANRGLAIQRLQGHIELAAQFGAAVIIGGIRGALSGSAGERAETRAAFVTAVHECARFAQARGVTILVEPINHYETNLINSAADGLALLGELQEPSVKLLLDTYHMNLEDRDLSASIQTVGKQLGYVHLVDSNRRAPGQGHLEYLPILHTLASINYAGWITAEILPLPDDGTALQDAARFFRTLKMRAIESVAVP